MAVEVKLLCKDSLGALHSIEVSGNGTWPMARICLKVKEQLGLEAIGRIQPDGSIKELNGV